MSLISLNTFRSSQIESAKLSVNTLRNVVPSWVPSFIFFRELSVSPSTVNQFLLNMFGFLFENLALFSSTGLAYHLSAQNIPLMSPNIAWLAHLCANVSNIIYDSPFYIGCLFLLWILDSANIFNMI